MSVGTWLRARPAPPAGLISRSLPDRLVLTWVVIPVLLVLLAHAGLRMAYPHSVEPDDADLVIFGQHVAWGYSDQGPVYSWLCEAAFAALGVGPAALAAVRLVVVFALALLLYANARLLVPDRRLAVPAAFAVLLIPGLSWHVLAYLTHTNTMLVGCLAALYAFLRLVRDGRTADYLLFGAACGVGVLCKYNFVWFLGSLLAAGLTVGPARRRLLDPRVLLAGAVGGLVALPHLLWLLDNRSGLAAILQTKVTRPEMARAAYADRVLRGTWDAANSAVLIALPAVVGVWLGFRGASRTGPDPNPARDAGRRVLGRTFLVAVVLVLAQIYVLGVSRFHERWLQPFAVVFPLWLFARLDPAAVRPAQVRRFAVGLAVLAVAYTGARAVQVGWFLDRPRGWYPMRMDFDELARQIEAEAGARPTIVTPDREVGGNLLLVLPGAQVSCTQYPLYKLPLRDGAPVVAVWCTRWDTDYGPPHDPQPPWLLLGEFTDRYMRPIPREAVRIVEVAPAAHGQPPTTVAFTVLHPGR